jgi:mersacidin/lichenicidin family type 2 lantibiotic
MSNLVARRERSGNVSVIRAWTDPAYLASLSAEELKNLPSHPAGEPLHGYEAISNIGVAGKVVFTANEAEDDTTYACRTATTQVYSCGNDECL